MILQMKLVAKKPTVHNKQKIHFKKPVFMAKFTIL